MQFFSVKNKVILITGTSRGIGKSLSLAFLNLGAIVIGISKKKNYAIKNKLGFLAVEYSGHGKSSGIFTKGNISEWSNDVKKSIEQKYNNLVSVNAADKKEKEQFHCR